MPEEGQAGSDGAAGGRGAVSYSPRHAVDSTSAPSYARPGEHESFRRELFFLKCSDVNSPFNHLEVSKGENQPAFIEIGVTPDYKLCLRLYRRDAEIELSLDDLMKIYAYASAFLPEAISLGDPILDVERELRATGREPQSD